MDGHRTGIGSASQSACPIRKAPASIGCGSELHHSAFVVGGLIRILSNRAMSGSDRKGVLVLSVVGSNRSVTMDGDRTGIGSASQSACPIRKAPASIGCGSELHHSAFVVGGLIRILSNRAMSGSD